MATPNFPTKLPLPIRDGFKGNLQRKPRVTKMDDGKTFIRRLYERQPNDYMLAWRFTWSQYELFEAFLKYDCWPNGGYFNMAVTAGAEPIELRMKKYPDARFNENANAWDVQVECEYYKGKPRGLVLSYAKPGYVKPGYWSESNAPTLNGYPLYPPSLPEPERSGYSLIRPDAIARSNIDNAKAEERERFKDHAINVQLTYLFNANEYAIFDSFYHDSLYDGVAPFMGPVANGDGLQTLRCKFLEPVQVTPVGNGYRVTATVETARMAVMDEQTYRNTIND